MSKMDENEKIAMGIGAAAVFLVPAFLVLAGLPILLLKAWVLSTLWRWYLLPGFGIPSPGVMILFGVVLMVNILRMRVGQENKLGFWKMMAAQAIGSLIILLVGWVGTFLI